MESWRTFCIPPLMVLSLYISFYHFLINALSVSQSCGSGYFGRIPIGLKKKPDQDLVKYPGPKFLFKPVSLKDKERHFIRSDVDPGFQGRIRIFTIVDPWFCGGSDPLNFDPAPQLYPIHLSIQFLAFCHEREKEKRRRTGGNCVMLWFKINLCKRSQSVLTLNEFGSDPWVCTTVRQIFIFMVSL